MWRLSLAIKPNDGETFLREVDEELRKARVNNFVTRYGWAIILGIVLFLGSIGGFIWWQGRQEAAVEAKGETLLNALERMESGGSNAAMPMLNELAESDVDGYRAAGLFARANAQVTANDMAGAIATLRGLAEDQGLEEPYRQAALVRQTQLEFDRLQPQQVVQRLSSLARPGQPWFGTAGEMVGISYMRMGRADQAGQLFGRIGRDETVPPSIRQRAIQMAGSLGVDALPETALGGDAAGGEGNQAAASPAAAEGNSQ